MQRQSWPRAWLMTDERMGETLLPAIARAASAGAGVIVRHHASDIETRRLIARNVIEHGALLGIARDIRLAAETGAALIHNPAGNPGATPLSLSVHHEEQARTAADRRPSLVFVSPVFATRSHPDAPALGPDRALHIAMLCECNAYALGGISREAGDRLIKQGWAGWAGIDAWT